MVDQRLGLVYAVSAATLFSFKPILVKLIYVYDVSTVTLLSWRMLISLPIYLFIGLLIWLRQAESNRVIPNHKQWAMKSILIGLLGYYLAALLDLQGLQTITAQLERLILFSYPSWVALLSWLIFKQPFGKNMFIALLLSYTGIAFIFISDWQQLGQGIVTGSIWVLLAALSFSLYIVLSKSIIDQIGSMEFTIIAMVASSVIALIIFFLNHHWHTLIIPMPAFWLIMAMSLLSTVVPSFLLAAAISNIGPTKTAIASTIGPVMTSVFAVVLLNEHFGWPQLTGLILIVIAVIALQTKPRMGL